VCICVLIENPRERECLLKYLLLILPSKGH
jgi:hypothetical protein